jgi:hypothetical protein
MDIFSTELGIRLSFVKLQNFGRGGGGVEPPKPPPPSVRHGLKGQYINLILKSGNAGYHSVQNLLPSSLLSKNLKIKIYRTIILPVAFYGYET